MVTSIANSFKRFCKNTSIQGFGHIGADNRHYIERVIWIIITFLALNGVSFICFGEWKRYNENPTVVILEKDFRTWNISFPGITICQPENINIRIIAESINLLWNVNETDEKWDYYMNFIKIVVNSSIFDLKHFEDYLDDKSLDVDFSALTMKIATKLNAKYTWHDSTITTQSYPIMTDAGLCHVINSLAVLQFDKYKKNISDIIKCRYLSQACFLRLDFQGSNTELYIHSPYDVNDAGGSDGNRKEIKKGSKFEIELTPIETKADPDIKSLAPQRRKCLYMSESRNGNNVYSVNTCHRNCRNELARKLCGCIPYFSKLLHGSKTLKMAEIYKQGSDCDLNGLVCLSKYSYELKTFMNNSRSVKKGDVLIDCVCPQQCEDVVYHENSLVENSWTSTLFKNTSSVKININAPRIRYKRVIVYHFQDLIVSLGGLAGLFLGVSFLTFIEVAYFLTLFVVSVVTDIKWKCRRN